MGRRGPAPTPTHTLRLRGSWRGDANDAEPPSIKGRPRCPQWLDAKARHAWRQIVPMLEQMRVLSKVDLHALTLMCRTWSQWREAQEFIMQHGETYPVKDKEGQPRYLKQFPQVTIANHCAARLTRMFQEFGMTPSARSRITALDSVSKGAEKDAGRARFFGSRGA